MVQLLEIVGDAARSGQQLVTGTFGRRRYFFHDRLGGGPGIYPKLALSTRNAVDGGLRREIAVEGDGAAGIVVPGYHVGDAIRVTVGIDHGGDRQTEAPRLLDGDVLLVRVDHEQQIGKAAHVLDPAERTVK